MSDIPAQGFPSALDAIFAQLNQQDVEQFYASFQQWALQKRIATLRHQVASVRQHIADNVERMQDAQPSPMALATLVRLQANGVNDIDLLDKMLERGEEWLDRTMQRLDYCEQLDDFIRDDYTQWCLHALEGAYDWIDSLREAATAPAAESPPQETSHETQETAVTEELLLQKLASEAEEEEEASPLDTTLMQAAIHPLPPEESAHINEGASTTPAEESAAPSEQPTPASEEYIPVQVEDHPDTSGSPLHEFALAKESPEVPPHEASLAAGSEEPVLQEYISLPTEEPSPEVEPPPQPAITEYTAPPADEASPTVSAPSSQAEEPGASETQDPPVQSSAADAREGEAAISNSRIRPQPPKAAGQRQRGFLRRVIGKIWGG